MRGNLYHQKAITYYKCTFVYSQIEIEPEINSSTTQNLEYGKVDVSMGEKTVEYPLGELGGVYSLC